MASFFLIGGNDFDLKSNYIAKQLLSLTNKKNPKILLFPTAMQDSAKAIDNFKKEYEGLIYTLDIAYLYQSFDQNDIISRAQKSDIIYFTGGNTKKVLDFITINNLVDMFIKLSKLNVIIAGVSAGANFWCNEGLADAFSYKDRDEFYNYKMLPGLGIINISFCPHFNENSRILSFRNLINSDLAYALDNNTAIYIKEDGKTSFFYIQKYHVYRFRKENNYIMEYLKKDKLAVLGPQGTFSEVAAIKYNELNKTDYEFSFYSSIQKTAQGIDKLSLGILPFENTIDGYVQETLDMLNKYNFTIGSEINVPVDFIFVSKNQSIKAIKKVYVQFKAKGQCLNFLNENNFEIIETESNITSFEKLKNSGPTYGAIIPSHIITKDFPLVIANICDKKNNFTRFLVINKDKKVNEINENYKCSLILNAKSDAPGILMDALMVFKKANINLTAIMSRPTKEELGKYYFYIEFNFIDDCGNIDEIINEINKEGKFDVKLLGYYKSFKGEKEIC